MDVPTKQRPDYRNDDGHKEVDGAGKVIQIVCARWNRDYTTALCNKVEETVLAAGGFVQTSFVPGAYELPFAAQTIISQNWKKGHVHAVVCVGVLIKGETSHFEYISEAVSRGLMDVQLKTGVPVIFGVLTVQNEEQAAARCGLTDGGHNHGEDWAWAAMEMADFIPQRDLSPEDLERLKADQEKKKAAKAAAAAAAAEEK